MRHRGQHIECVAPGRAPSLGSVAVGRCRYRLKSSASTLVRSKMSCEQLPVARTQEDGVVRRPRSYRRLRAEIPHEQPHGVAAPGPPGGRSSAAGAARPQQPACRSTRYRRWTPRGPPRPGLARLRAARRLARPLGDRDLRHLRVAPVRKVFRRFGPRISPAKPRPPAAPVPPIAKCTPPAALQEAAISAVDGAGAERVAAHQQRMEAESTVRSRSSLACSADTMAYTLRHARPAAPAPAATRAMSVRCGLNGTSPNCSNPIR